MRLVLCDFDGTVTYRDSMGAFLRYVVGSWRYYLKLAFFAPFYTLFLLRIIDNSRAKNELLRRFLGGMEVEKIRLLGGQFAVQKLPSMVRPQALQALLEYQAQGDTVVIVTASMQTWMEPWCNQYGFECISSVLEEHDGVLTGHMTGKNCHGKEKVARIKARFELSTFDEIIAYGDTRGDLPMLALAHRAFYKPFR
ncbi:MAG: hypothetical protein KU37_00030 [Sulfuricurvum sp. PC08-66]|nr:MAG: hypothetical protein KU37_00030 [Sulfuricurvum sp. PC08-66]